MRKSARDVVLILSAAVGVSVFGGVSLFRRTEELRRVNPVLRGEEDVSASPGAAAPGRPVGTDALALRGQQDGKQEGNEGANRAIEAKTDPSNSSVPPPQPEQQDGAEQQDGHASPGVAAPGTAVEADVEALRRGQEEEPEGGRGANSASGAKEDSPSSVAHRREQQGVGPRNPQNLKYIALIAERHSGSTWMLKFLQDYFRGLNITVTATLCTWKHWFQDRIHQDIQDGKRHCRERQLCPACLDIEHTLVIAMWRNPYDWISGMQKIPWHSQAHQGVEDLSTFMTMPWTMKPEAEKRARADALTKARDQAPCIDNFLPWEVLPCEPMNDASIYELDPEGQTYGNVYELRKAKIRDFNAVKLWAPYYEKILYEDMLEGDGLKVWLKSLETIYGLSGNYKSVPNQELAKKMSTSRLYMFYMNSNNCVPHCRMGGSAGKRAVETLHQMWDDELEGELGTCAELEAAAEAAATSGDILGQLTEAEIACDDWVNVEVAGNKLKLDGDAGTSYTLEKIRFVVKSGAVLRVEVPVEFTGGDVRVESGVAAAVPGLSQTVNGGALNVEEGARVRFVSSVKMGNIGVDTVDLDNMVHGGCVYNQGLIRFEGDFYAEDCHAVSSIDDFRVAMGGNGAGIYNGEGGQVVFKQAVEMRFCGNWPWGSNGPEPGADGGAIYTDGKVSFFEDALFEHNEGDEGSALWIGASGVVKFLKRSKARFLSNSGYGNGGAVYNGGNLVMRNTAEFSQGRTSFGKGGCIYYGPSAEAMFTKSVSFFGCTTDMMDGGAIYIDYANLEFLPQDATFDSNRVLNNAWVPPASPTALAAERQTASPLAQSLPGGSRGSLAARRRQSLTPHRRNCSSIARGSGNWKATGGSCGVSGGGGGAMVPVASSSEGIGRPGGEGGRRSRASAAGVDSCNGDPVSQERASRDDEDGGSGSRGNRSNGGQRGSHSNSSGSGCGARGPAACGEAWGVAATTATAKRSSSDRMHSGGSGFGRGGKTSNSPEAWAWAGTGGGAARGMAMLNAYGLHTDKQNPTCPRGTPGENVTRHGRWQRSQDERGARKVEDGGGDGGDGGGPGNEGGGDSSCQGSECGIRAGQRRSSASWAGGGRAGQKASDQVSAGQSHRVRGGKGRKHRSSAFRCRVIRDRCPSADKATRRGGRAVGDAAAEERDGVGRSAGHHQAPSSAASSSGDHREGEEGAVLVKPGSRELGLQDHLLVLPRGSTASPHPSAYAALPTTTMTTTTSTTSGDMAATTLSMDGRGGSAAPPHRPSLAAAVSASCAPVLPDLATAIGTGAATAGGGEIMTAFEADSGCGDTEAGGGGGGGDDHSTPPVSRQRSHSHHSPWQARKHPRGFPGGRVGRNHHASHQDQGHHPRERSRAEGRPRSGSTEMVDSASCAYAAGAWVAGAPASAATTFPAATKPVDDSSSPPPPTLDPREPYGRPTSSGNAVPSLRSVEAAAQAEPPEHLVAFGEVGRRRESGGDLDPFDRLLHPHHSSVGHGSPSVVHQSELIDHFKLATRPTSRRGTRNAGGGGGGGGTVGDCCAPEPAFCLFSRGVSSVGTSRD
eukprot:g1314.t1